MNATLIGLGGEDREKSTLQSPVGTTGAKCDGVSALFSRAVQHQNNGRFGDALALYQTIIELEPNLAEVHCNIGAILANLDKLQAAEVAYRRAISLKPNFAAAYNNLALVLRDLGQLSEAYRIMEQAIRLAPNEACYYANLAKLKSFSPGDPYLQRLEALAKNCSSLSSKDRVHLHFGLAKAYEDLGLFDSAFEQARRGNDVKRRGFVYDEASVLGGLAAVEAEFTPQLIRSRAGFGDGSKVPVFIMGMPRSGTTLIEQILSSHPEVFGAGELRLLDQTVASMSHLVPGLPAYPKMMSVIKDAHLNVLGARYVSGLTQRAPQARRIVDKMPTNFFFAGLIHLALPNATIIHATRDPADNCVSCFFTQFDGPQPFDDLAELGRYYRHYQALMEHWHRVLPADRILDVHYEEVVGDIRGAAQRIVAHCGLDWDDRCLDFHLAKRAVRTPSAVQVRQPIYTSSVGRWRKYQAFLKPLLSTLEESDKIAFENGQRKVPNYRYAVT
jgi:Sulfotransferase family/Tetratricopeptide repeat